MAQALHSSKGAESREGSRGREPVQLVGGEGELTVGGGGLCFSFEQVEFSLRIAAALIAGLGWGFGGSSPVGARGRDLVAVHLVVGQRGGGRGGKEFIDHGTEARGIVRRGCPTVGIATITNALGKCWFPFCSLFFCVASTPQRGRADLFLKKTRK